MSKKNKNMWFSWSKKPENFKFVSNNGNYRFYSYDIPIFHNINVVDILNINVKYLYKDDDILIDFNYLYNIINMDDNITIDDKSFIRDKKLFPFIYSIEINDYDNYLHFKKLRNRKEKILKLKNLTK
ncbi:hypothetical protein [Trichloromonas sp.]|uniref:hypothetical protein n=1 Tax=Trichloromonas sp. TaxID=3069249 RepID=UPI002A487D57|nr:hypothetical protein [Trichloromonas sp.]